MIEQAAAEGTRIGHLNLTAPFTAGADHGGTLPTGLQMTSGALIEMRHQGASRASTRT